MEIPEHVITAAKRNFSGFDADFFERVWLEGVEKYKERINAIEFRNMERVLDAGFGMGQWIIPLGQMNNSVEGVECSIERVKAVEQITSSLNLNNIVLKLGSIEELDYPDNSFDGILCYSVLFLTDYRKALREFFRVLKPGGKLYFTANGIGWYLYCILNEHNKTAFYDPRKMGVECIKNTINYFAGRVYDQTKQLIIPRDIIESELTNLGFTNVTIKSEGEINLNSPNKNKSFYAMSEYLGCAFIYEVLAVK